ncbi:MAG TPA: phospholipase C, phosphocholine-specific [Hyphomonadaceae bacterium]|nr:phospholipase C, phosphocholine-specific [Hyphomonadaceae bacterium]
MPQVDRRKLLLAAAASLALPASIAKAWAIDAKSRTKSIKDVEHIVILMQENRSFDHYFGSMKGVNGFGDRFPIPVPDTADRKGKTVWSQLNADGRPGPKVILPFPLNTKQTFAHMRIEGTPHNWADAQAAWDEGRVQRWPAAKGAHAMGHFLEEDIPFQWALANAFTLCDAYHCSFQGGTNTNRLFLWSGTNDGAGKQGGPSIANSHDTLPSEKNVVAKDPYLWTTYPERLQKAGVSWRIYEDMADNFGDNPLVGFKAYRDSLAKAPGSDPKLVELGLSTQHLDVLRKDVMADKLPSVSWVISPAKDSEHPGPSSPAQGADYISRVLDALTSNPEVWAKTVLFVMFDENDGFFDHAPTPAPPSHDASGALLGGSTVNTDGEYHLVSDSAAPTAERKDLMGRPYGLGPRVPLYVISPWTRGGWVNSQVFDHTSVIRFVEERFGVKEPNISAWRRAVCGDLTSCFDFDKPNDDTFFKSLPETAAVAARAAALPGRTTPPTPAAQTPPSQNKGARPSRSLPYNFSVDDVGQSGKLKLSFKCSGSSAVVLHAYDRLRLGEPSRRYTVEFGKSLEDEWLEGPYDVMVFGPNGFFRHFIGSGDGDRPKLEVVHDGPGSRLQVQLYNAGAAIENVTLTPAAYGDKLKAATIILNAKGAGQHTWQLADTYGWYDFELKRSGNPNWRVRIAGRVQNLKNLMSDPALGGAAVMDQPKA